MDLVLEDADEGNKSDHLPCHQSSLMTSKVCEEELCSILVTAFCLVYAMQSFHHDPTLTQCKGHV